MAEPWLARVCDRPESDLTLEGLRALCRAGEGQLVLIGPAGGAPVAAGVTQVRQHRDESRSCWCSLASVGGAAPGRGGTPSR